MIRGGIAKLAKAASLQGAIAGSKPAPASNFAVPVSALTPTGTFNHTAEAMWPKQPELYCFRCVIPREENTSWKRENKKGLK